MMRNYLIGLSIAIIIYAVVLSWLIIRDIIVPPDLLDTIILFILASATIFYALRTSDIAEATRQQADASVKMAEEMRQQTIMSSRPWIIQKAIHEDEKKIRPIEDSFDPDYFSHFEIYNAGNGPAIELEISLRDRLDKEGTGLHSHREPFLLAGGTLEFHPFNMASLDESKVYYLACEYKSVFSRSSNTWYQTLLPFEPVKSSRDDGIYVKADELEFKEVTEKERIDAFSWRRKQND